MIIAVDFDDTIHDTKNVSPGYKMGLPIPDAVEAMKELSKRHTLIIHTVWAVDPRHRKAIEDWLKYFEVPFESITSQKPMADVYLDDKGMKFTTWEEALDGLSATD
jgi:hypothetical protein